MSFSIEDMQGGSEPIPKGNFPAVITGLVTYGVQPQTDWKTKEPKPSEKRLALTFEFPTEAVEKEQDDGTVVTIARRLTKEYKVSSHKKANIMILIRSIAPDIKDLSDLLGKGCSAEVGRTETGKAKIAGVAPLMKGVEAATPLDGLVSFDFYAPTEEGFKSITQWQQDMIVNADDYKQDDGTGFADAWVTPKEEGDY